MGQTLVLPIHWSSLNRSIIFFHVEASKLASFHRHLSLSPFLPLWSPNKRTKRWTLKNPKKRKKVAKMETIFFFLLLTTSCFSFLVESSDNNHMYSPCGDTKVERSDGFTFAIAFASRSSFFLNNSQQLSPCDRRLSLSSSTSQIAVFRPKVDEISLLTINTSSFSPVTYIFFNSLFVFF